MFFQIGALYFGVGLFLFVYVIAYISAIIYSAIRTSRGIRQTGNLKIMTHSLIPFFIANLILFIIYLPTLVYNPEINWKLKGEAEQDPMILLAYIPPAFLVIAFVILIMTAIVTKIISAKMHTT